MAIFHQRFRRWLLLLGGVLVLHAGAQTQTISPEARDVLDRLASVEFATLRGSIRIDSSSPLSIQGSAPTERSAVTIVDVTLAPPSRFHIAVTSPNPDGDGICASDGDQALYLSRMLGQAALTDPPASLADIGMANLTMTGCRTSFLLLSALGLPPPLLARVIESDRTAGRLLEPREVCGAVCDVVELVAAHGGKEMTLLLFIDHDPGLLRRLEMTMPTAQGQSAQTTEEFLSLTLGDAVTAEDFLITPPPGMEIVPALDPTAVIRQFGVTPE